MKKQFEILAEIAEFLKNKETHIASLKQEIEKASNEIRKKLVNAYPHDKDVIYLVNFSQFQLTFYKATKTHLHELVISWYESNYKITKPNDLTEGMTILNEYDNPTNCEIRSFQTFGYFHDIEKTWDRLSWITEETREGNYLYEISKDDFAKAVHVIKNFYLKP